MTVFVADKNIRRPGDLSDIGRLVLSFIDGGVEWLDWAGQRSATIYRVPDETALVSEVQKGLHAAPIFLLPKLEIMVSPMKLMTLDISDLRTLARAEGGNKSATNNVQLKQVMTQHGLLTRADLASGTTFLREIGVEDSPLFQAFTFADYLAVYDLLKFSKDETDSDSDLQKEAAQFGIRQGRTPSEFVDYYRCFLSLAKKLGVLDQSLEKRAALADKALQTLLPLLFETLNCPQTRGFVAPSEVSRAVKNWFASGKLLGFSQLSEGAKQIIQYSSFTTEVGDAARTQVMRYLEGAKSLLAVEPLRDARMRQDGSACRFVAQHADNNAELLLDESGVITLLGFGKTQKASVPDAA